MPFNDLRKLVIKTYGAALSLRRLIPPERRHLIHTNLVYASLFLFAMSLIAFGIEDSAIGSAPGLSIIATLAPKLYGLFLIIFATSFVFSSLEAFHRSYYFRGLDLMLKEINDHSEHMSWEVATIVDETDFDITKDFMTSTFGQEILYRAGVEENSFNDFMEHRKPTLSPDGFIVDQDGGIMLATYARSVYKQDNEFKQFLARNNITEQNLIHAAEWTTRIERRERRERRWWSRDNLGRIPGLGKTWSYGQTYYLERFGHELTEDHIWPSAIMSRRDEDDEVEELEELLSRARQSNAMLLTNDVLTARRRVAQLYHKIREGRALPPIEARRIFMLDIESMVIATEEKAAFEATLRNTLNQAVSAGNIIVYFENISATIKSAQILGVDTIDILQPYFESYEIQLIIGELSANFDKHLSRDTRIAQAFDIIEMKDISNDGVFELLEQRAYMHEKHSNIVFTVPALEKIAELADRYFPTGVMPDKAFDLLEELIPMVLARGSGQVVVQNVEDLVARKTHVPVGEPEAEEREKLLQLEDVLHKRVISQEGAILAISKALRRARSGVGDPNKPIGSFLFLGPTGVGKTETAKALAEVLFNDENAMIRLDMTEFQTATSLEDLIGSATTGSEGRLEPLVRKQQYGVLLLDEFEKSSTEVRDLFLQILDEGHFTTTSGKRVNMKNLIIIASGNAGAELVWEMEQHGKDVTKHKKELVDYMVKNKIFRPELLNRFDDIIIFHALAPEHVKEIARIHLEKFAKRLAKEKNITVEVTNELVDMVAKKGYDPQFGGRPLQRAIKEEVEQRIAEEILKGTLHAGDTYTFTHSA